MGSDVIVEGVSDVILKGSDVIVEGISDVIVERVATS